MHPFERWCYRLRHSPRLEKAEGLWRFFRPCYEWVLNLLGGGTVERMINGTDWIRLPLVSRHTSEIYEPDVWKRLMDEVCEGDVVIDVGAYIGLYTIPLAKRVGPKGKVVAFEPDPENFTRLKEHVALNSVGERVELIQAAVGIRSGTVPFKATGQTGSHVTLDSRHSSHTVRSVTLDEILLHRRVDLIKIDVEGYEEKVLEGGLHLLSDPSRRPRAIFMEVHPFAWEEVGTSAESLLGLLARLCYRTFDMNGRPVGVITSWSWVVAYKGHDP